MKFIGAIMICCIHITPLSTNIIPYSRYINFVIQNYLCRIAVPFYFAAAGFFLYRKINLHSFDNERIKRYVIKLIRLLGVWTIILILGGSYQLWFLGGLVITVGISWLMISKRYSLKKMLVVSSLLYIIGSLSDSHFGIIEKVSNAVGITWLTEAILYFQGNFSSLFRLGVFSGVLFFTMGILFANKRIYMPVSVSIIGFLLSMGALLGEVYIVKHFGHAIDHNIYYCLVPVTFFLFYFFTNIKIKPAGFYVKLRVVGMLVFYLHLFIKWIIEIPLSILKNKTGIDLFDFLLFLTIIFSIIVSILIERLSNKEKFGFLKLLYS